MPTRRQFLKFAGGSSLAALSWMTSSDGDIREVYQAIPGKQGPREKRGRPPNKPMPDFTAARHPHYTEADVAEVERVHFEGVNRYREKRDQGKLEWSDNLAYIARRHSLEQSTEKFTGHDDHTDQGREFRDEGELATSLTDRVEVYGYQSAKMLVSENTMWMPFGITDLDGEGSLRRSDQQHLAEIALDSFKESSSHNAAMLDGRYDTVGVGVTLAQTDYRTTGYHNTYLDLRVTQLFTGPMEGFEWVVRS